MEQTRPILAVEQNAEQNGEQKASELRRAFDVFNQVSLALTQSYQDLQARVESLTAELAVANGALRRQYEEKQALSERLALLLDALPGGVIVLDSASTISQANPAACAFFGCALVGEKWQALAERSLTASETPGEWQLDAHRLAIVESPLDSAGGRILLLHDLSAAHTLKVELARKQRLAAMGEMAASLAHQLRTPLATALLYSGNLAQPALSPAARVRFAERLSSQLRRLERLIQEVLLFARGESIGREAVAVAQLLADAAQTVEPLFAERRVGLRVHGESAARTIVIGSRKALCGALVNLLENALQACEVGGEVVCAAVSAAGELRIAVRDTGCGIGAENAPRVFEPFFTTRGQGTGLGLAIALAVARAHGGTIELASRGGEASAHATGQGAEFVVVLPVHAAANAEGMAADA